MSGESRSRPNAESLRLQVLDDMQNFAVTDAEKFQRLNISQFGVGESYISGASNIHITLASIPEGRQYDLVCSRSITEVGENTKPTFSDVEIAESNLRSDRLGSDNKCSSVLVRTRNFSEQPEEVITAGMIIPSWIRFITAESGEEFFWDVFTATVSECCIQVVWVGSERKVSISARLSHDMMGGGINCLIQGIPQIFNDIRGHSAKPERQWGNWNDVVRRLGIRIELFDHSCRVVLVKPFDEAFEVVNFGFCKCS